MKFTFTFTATAAAMLSAVMMLPSAQAQMRAEDVAAAQAVAASNGCTNCHDASIQLMGPAFKEIARRYKGKKVELELAKRIREGSEGRWGELQHPANAALEPAQASLLARWILAGAP